MAHKRTEPPKAASGWRPIATAPRDGTNILLAWGQDGVSQGHYIPGIPHPWKFIDTNDGITWLINHAVDGPGGPTHWQPMPLAVGVEVIPATWQHDAGAYARCSFCLRYTRNPDALSQSSFLCDCGSAEGWSGSFAKPGPDARWLASDGVTGASPDRAAAMVPSEKKTLEVGRTASVSEARHQTFPPQDADAPPRNEQGGGI